jgi:hypothetical protein
MSGHNLLAFVSLILLYDVPLKIELFRDLTCPVTKAEIITTFWVFFLNYTIFWVSPSKSISAKKDKMNQSTHLVGGDRQALAAPCVLVPRSELDLLPLCRRRGVRRTRSWHFLRDTTRNSSSSPSQREASSHRTVRSVGIPQGQAARMPYRA